MENADEAQGYMVAWRRDRRFSRKVTLLTSFGDRARAISNALSISSRYVPPSPPSSNRTRDGRRGAVYAWENSLPAGKLADISGLQALADRICDYFGITPVHVTNGDARLVSSSFFSPSRGIVIADGMTDETTLWHELSHYLVWKMGIEEPAHGPAFVATLVAIRSLFGNQGTGQCLNAAAAMNIEVNAELLRGLLEWRSSVTRLA
jgi:hypothetical protein